MQRYPGLISRDMKDLYASILEPNKFDQFLTEVLFSPNQNVASNKELQGLTNLPTNAPGTVIKLDVDYAKLQLDRMHSRIDTKAVQVVLAYFNRIFRQISRGIFVQQSGVDAIKKLIAANERVILLPVYKSFADFPVLLYTLFVNRIEIPFTFGNLEDIPKAPLIKSLLTRLGYILTRRSRSQSLQTSYTTQALFAELLDKYRIVMMFKNDLRIRSGKYNQPTHPDIAIQWLLQSYLVRMQKEGKNVHIVPISVQYERLFELRNIASEMVSGDIPRQTLP